ncbi:hypothetical protein [Zhihengliuella halotolerans]|uniref:DUF2127 domain-containing protein n=1 Tax=Zhihengliuella halotolerans TaxID=370736 RepID=A0A4Q8AD57_9MICC|nr:hypothetical protein [Zhihengliuella halotolerans]RZU62160.1 hypothetical protein EV380_1749 [Zhihengliuella halotolerans]
MSDHPVAPEARQTAGGEPAEFTRLKRLTIASLLLFMIAVAAGVLGALDADTMREQLDSAGSPTDETAVQLAQAVALAIAGGSAVGGLAAYVLVIKGLYHRRNWARVLGMVFAVLSIITYAFSLTTSAPLLATGGLAVASLAVEGLALLVSGYWLVLGFNAQVAEYLRRPRNLA